MKHILSGIFAAAFALSASAAAQAQDKPPLKIGGILDMSSLYADITGPGSETAAKMAVEDFGGEVLGRKIQVLAADISTRLTCPPTSPATCSTTRASR